MSTTSKNASSSQNRRTGTNDVGRQVDGYFAQLETLDDAIDEMESAIEHWEECAKLYYTHKTNLEAWEAATKKAYMHAGMSGVAAEAEMKCKGQFMPGHGSTWADHTQKVNTAMIAERAAHKRLRVAEMRWETERSKAATLRQLV